LKNIFVIVGFLLSSLLYYIHPAAQRKRYLGNKMKLNDTTRTYPRTMQEAYPNTYDAIEARQRWEWLEGHQSDAAAQAEFWVYIACAFAAGFVVSQLWG
jgi:hypothetical protein